MKLHQPPIYDPHWEGMEVAADDTHRYLWLWQGYNIRLVAIPADESGVWAYEHGWCYPRDPTLVTAAVAAWDADVEDEPPGWHKRATPGPRRAPHRDQSLRENRPRCLHGCYIADGCRTVNCPDAPAADHHTEEVHQ